MRLNVLSQTIIVGNALRAHGVHWINPRIGTPHLVNESIFKYSSTWGTPKCALIERVSLNALFDQLPQDITLFSFDPSLEVDLSVLQERQAINRATQEYIADNNPDETGAENHPLVPHFLRWKRLIGLNDLKVRDVLLSLVDNQYLLVDARNSPLYSGTVSIKIK